MKENFGLQFKKAEIEIDKEFEKKVEDYIKDLKDSKNKEKKVRAFLKFIGLKVDFINNQLGKPDIDYEKRIEYEGTLSFCEEKIKELTKDKLTEERTN